MSAEWKAAGRGGQEPACGAEVWAAGAPLGERPALAASVRRKALQVLTVEVASAIGEPDAENQESKENEGH